MYEQPCGCNIRLLTGQQKDMFFREHFIPREWRLYYDSLSSRRALLQLVGYCKDCQDSLVENICLPEAASEDDLLETIYHTMQTTHPYDQMCEGIGYYGPCDVRSAFYRARDRKPLIRRNREFLNLFHDYDRSQVRNWLEIHYPTYNHADVLRDTGGDLFCNTVRLAREHGDFSQADAILDYVLPGPAETGCHERQELTSYDFTFVPIIDFGCEGVYLTCYLKGKFDDSGRSSLQIGTLKTLKTSVDACKIMGELGGALMFHANQYVNANLHRFTSERELQAESEQH